MLRLPRRFQRTALGIAAASLLGGCILVDDFGAAWQASSADPCLSDMAKSIYATEFRRDPTGLPMDDLAHGWTLGANHYLLLKKRPGDTGGRLYRFTVTHGIFQRYRLDPVMKQPFEKAHPNAPVHLKNDTVRIDALTPETEALLSEIAGDSAYWQVEEQALYNTVRNPACRFDDRDLSKQES